MPAERNPSPPAQVDLHRRSREEAQRALIRELHACRVRGLDRLLVITGRGYGNRTHEPVLRNHIEAWLGGGEARALGVEGFQRAHRGGALEVRLNARG
jgi:DNA-nicking Smr family endonuclease